MATANCRNFPRNYRSPAINFNCRSRTQLPQFKSDVSIVKRVLTELLNNACKYTPESETIEIHASSTNDGIKLSVLQYGG